MVVRRRLFWKVSLTNAALIAAALSIFLWVLAIQLRRSSEETQRRYLLGHAVALRTVLADKLSDPAALRSLLEGLCAQDPSVPRITVVSPGGDVLADSAGDSDTMETHANRPEIVEALRTGIGTANRFSSTVSKNMAYVAIRVGTADAPGSVIRVAMPESSIASLGWSVEAPLMFLGASIAAAAIGVTLLLTQRWSRRMRQVIAAAQQMARGDWGGELPSGPGDEVDALVGALKRLHARFTRQLVTITDQKKTLQALVECLREGVLVIGRDGTVLTSNVGAARLLGLDHPPVGSPVEQCVSNYRISQMLAGFFEGRADDPHRPTPDAEVRTQLPSADGPRSILARASQILLPASEEEPGVRTSAQTAIVLVLSDITAIERAARTQTEFVTNASHELRTPLSAILAAVETLRSLDFHADADAVRSFLKVIFRHSERLSTLIGDLLSLAKLEAIGAPLQELSAQQISQEIHDRWEPAAAAKQLRWTCEATADTPRVRANSQFLHLALDNLIENAIHFTDPGKSVALRVYPNGNYVHFEVHDEGCGIPAEDIERVFERFYQVDPARTGHASRGAGLGLSIVRQVAESLKGKVSLQSTLGAGTRVTLSIPAAPQ